MGAVSEKINIDFVRHYFQFWELKIELLTVSQCAVTIQVISELLSVCWACRNAAHGVDPV